MKELFAAISICYAIINFFLFFDKPIFCAATLFCNFNKI